MNKTKEQQAQEYAEKKTAAAFNYISPNIDTAENLKIPVFTGEQIKQAYLDGYTACEQSMWRSVEEELPEDNTLVVVWIFGSAVLTDFCEDGKWHYQGVRFWMPLPELPSLPDTNTEKQ